MFCNETRACMMFCAVGVGCCQQSEDTSVTTQLQYKTDLSETQHRRLSEQNKALNTTRRQTVTSTDDNVCVIRALVTTTDDDDVCVIIA